MDIILPVYNISQTMLNRHIQELNKIPKNRIKDFRLIIIDDCSTPSFNPNLSIDMSIKAARVEVDVKWHAEGAINLGFVLANDDWCILTCVDHIIPTNDLVQCLDLKKEKNNIYMFNRFLPNGKSRRKNVPGVCIIHRDDWWRLGGYDEDFCGKHGCADWLTFGCFHSGGEGYNQLSVAKQLRMNFIQTNLKIIEYADECCSLSRANRRNYGIYFKKVKELEQGIYINRSKLNFRWHLTYERVC